MNKCVMNSPDAAKAAERIMQRCDALAEISETPGALTRVHLTPEHLRANALVGKWMEEAGMKVWQDSIGNICGRYEGQHPEAKALLLGSHLDTVRNAGRYDGILGVVTAIETVQYLHDRGERLPLALEVVGFCDEEGTRFGISLLGSHALAGKWPEAWNDCKDKNGITVAEAMQQCGLHADRIWQSARDVDDFIGYLELHIEQGPCLEQEGLALGVVTAIIGSYRLSCHFTGEAGHAGTVPMMHRKDAMAAASEWMVYIEQRTRQAGEYMVATVGNVQCSPGSINVIPGQVALTLDIRGPQDDALEALLAELLAKGESIAQERGMTFHSEIYDQSASTCFDEKLQEALTRTVTQVQGRSISLPSGAGHDATALDGIWPTAMLFVRCERGISHNPAEAVTHDDVALAVQAWVQVVKDIAGEAA